MKCPKCGYISFDYNKNCPKCKKSLLEQSTKMNMPDYKAAPPYLLGSLPGKVAYGGGASIGMDIVPLSAEDLQRDGFTGGPGYMSLKPGFPGNDEGMEFDLHNENCRRTLEKEIRQNEAGEHSNSICEEISFDPGAIGLKGGSGGHEESGITPEVIDFELLELENEDEEKKG